MYLPLAAAAACVLIAAVAKALPLLLRCFRAKRSFLDSNIPGPPLSSSIVGHVPELLGPKAPWIFVKWANQYGCIFKMQFLDALAVVVSDPDTIARITRKTSPCYMPKPHHLYAPLESSYSPKRPNLVSAADGGYSRAVRQATAPCFSFSNLKQVVPLVLELSKRVADHLAKQAPGDVEVTDAAKRITSDVMGQLLYGEDLGGTRWVPSEYLSVLYPCLKAQSAMFLNPFYLWQLWDPEVRNQRHCLARHNELIAEKIRRLRQHPPEEHTIAAHILSAIDPATKQPLDDSQVKAEVATFMAAGFETTSHAITWCLTLLAAFPDTQSKVYAELQAAGLAASQMLAAADGGDDDDDASGSTAAGSSSSSSIIPRGFEASDLGRLPLLSAVIKESLRLCPPAPFGGTRQAVLEEGTEMCGYKVDKGTLVMIPLLPYSLAQHTYGSDALDFKPERWLATASAETPAAAATAAGGASDGDDDNDDSTISATTTAPAPAAPDQAVGSAARGKGAAAGPATPPDPLTFLTGPRDCIGQNLAKLELQVVLATLLSRFTFSPGPELHRELQLAAATGQPALMAVHALAGCYVTLQPLSGAMRLRVTARRSQAEGVETEE